MIKDGRAAKGVGAASRTVRAAAFAEEATTAGSCVDQRTGEAGERGRNAGCLAPIGLIDLKISGRPTVPVILFVGTITIMTGTLCQSTRIIPGRSPRSWRSHPNAVSSPASSSLPGGNRCAARCPQPGHADRRSGGPRIVGPGRANGLRICEIISLTQDDQHLAAAGMA